MRLSEKYDLKGKIFVFLKFGQKGHLESLKNGNLYMNNFNYFIKREDIDQKKGVGDKFEVAHVITNMTATMYDDEKDEIAIGHVEVMTLRSTSDLKKPIFCLTAITADDLEIVEETDDKLKTKLVFTEEEIIRIKEDFGEHVLIISPGNMLQQLEVSCEASDIVAVKGMVNYVDYNVNEKSRTDSFANHRPDFYFWKNKELRYQKEYRIVLLNRDVDNHFEMNIGKLEDAVLIERDKFLKSKFMLTFNKEPAGELVFEKELT